MSLNWKEIDAVLEEFALPGKTIRQIRQPNFRELVIDLHGPDGRSTLFISLESGSTRLHPLTRGVRSEVGLQRFAQLLRSRIVGGVMTAAKQLGEERIVRIDVDRSGETTIIFIRLWGGAANIIATDEEFTIIDAYFRRPGRGEVSGAAFDPTAAVGTPAPKRRTFDIREFPGDGTLGERIERYYRELIEETGFDTLRERLVVANDRSRSRLEARIADARSRLEASESGEDFKRYGDLVSSNLYRIARGDRRVVVADYYHEGTEVEIELDPALSGGENADRYYRRYKKERARTERLTSELEALETEEARLVSERARIDAAATVEELEQIAGPVSGGAGHAAAAHAGRKAPGLEFVSGSYTIYVGRSAEENDALLRRHARGNDYWLHSRDTPGGYVFVRSIPGKSIPLDVLLDAGNLAIYYSKAKSGGGGDLFYTQVKYLRRAKTGKPGLVIPTQEKNLSIRIDEARLGRLFGHHTGHP